MNAVGYAIFQFIRISFRLWDILTTFGFRLFYCGMKKKLPPITDLWLLESAVSLASKIRTRKIKSYDIVQAFVTRIKDVQPVINAVVDERFDDALEEARKADEFIASGKKSEQELAIELPFLGVPFTVKECIGVKGMKSSCGLVEEKDSRAKEDSGIVELMRKSGAIPIAATNVSQMCSWMESTNTVYGTTLNPYDTCRGVGGSSGGEAALMASAGSVIGIGSDLAGSIRVPCFFNGVFGHKPTAGITPVTGKFPNISGKLDDFVCTGPICRYAIDLLPLLKVMAGNNISRLKLHVKVNMRLLKYYCIEEIIGRPLLTPVHPEIKDCINKVRNQIEYSFGTRPKKLKMDKLGYAIEMWLCKIRDLDTVTYESLLPASGKIDVGSEVIKWLLRRSNYTFPVMFALLAEKLLPGKKSQIHSYFLKMFSDVQNELQELLGNNGVLILPGFPEPTQLHGQILCKPLSIVYTCLFNVLGLPVTYCPLGLNSQGLPIGVQIVSGKNNDHICISLATELEKAFGGWVTPSEIL